MICPMILIRIADDPQFQLNSSQMHKVTNNNDNDKLPSTTDA